MSKEAKPDPAMERRIIERTTPRDVKVGRSNVPASTQKAVLLALATFAGCSVIRPSYDAIAERACSTPETVRRALKALQIQGLIGKTVRHWSGGGRRPNQYHFRFKAMAATNTQPDTLPEDMDAATDEYVEAVEGGWETPPVIKGEGAVIQGGVPCNTGGVPCNTGWKTKGKTKGKTNLPP